MSDPVHHNSIRLIGIQMEMAIMNPETSGGQPGKNRPGIGSTVIACLPVAENHSLFPNGPSALEWPESHCETGSKVDGMSNGRSQHHPYASESAGSKEPSKPLVCELYAGKCGWGRGFVAEGWRHVGFDIVHEDHHKPIPTGCNIVLQDCRTLHGSQFKDVSAFACSPPCQTYSWMAMPWSKSKRKAAWYREDLFRQIELNELFFTCYRIQMQASIAAGRYIPMVIENVKGAQPWVGKAKCHYGSYYLWSEDLEDIGGRIVASGPVRFGMPSVKARKTLKGFGGTWFHNAELGTTNPNRSRTTEGRKVPGMNFHDHEKGLPGRSFQPAAVASEGRKGFTTGLGRGHDWRQDPSGRFNSKSNARKAASAAIAEIPFELSRHVARIFRPT